MVESSEAAPEAHLIVWGTDVNIQDTKRRFRDFLQKFVNDHPDQEETSPMNEDRAELYYMQRLDEVHVYIKALRLRLFCRKNIMLRYGLVFMYMYNVYR